MRYPKKIEKGNYIGTTAPSAGISKEGDFPRLDNVKNNFEKRGYKYIETANVRTDEKGRSSSAEERAKQFMELWKEEKISAIISACGGDFETEIIEKLDFDELKKIEPKWFQGYSDNTVLVFLLTTILDTACIYGNNIKDFGMRNLHESLENTFKIMQREEIIQKSFEKYETSNWEERVDPLEEYTLENKVQWKNLKNEEKINFKGRSIGGCFDVIVNLIGTKYDFIKEYISRYKDDGIVWFLEIFEMSTPQIYLHLWQMKNAGYFENCKGIIFGRGLMIREDYDISFEETLKEIFKDMDIPVIYDADIGHVAPQMPILSGGILEISSEYGKGQIKNYFK